MNDTERSLDDVARLHTEIMRERAEGLQEAAQAAKERLIKREEALSRLRVQVAALKASLQPPPPVHRPVVVPVIPARPAAIREKEAFLDSATVKASLPRTAPRRSLLPYAAIAACAILIDMGGRRRAAVQAPDLNALAHPAPAVVAAGARPAAKGAPVVVDDDRSQEALLLVHQWTLPGDSKPLGERLGGELDLPGGRPAWTVERTGARGYRVTFQAAEKDLPYSFEADVEARVVWPTPETQELLAPRFTAALRDAVR